MSHSPFPGEVHYLPGSAFLTCKVCGVTTILGLPYPIMPLRYTCTGCQRQWQIQNPPLMSVAFRWYEIKENANA